MIPHEKLYSYQLRPGDLIILASDGVVDGSRATYSLVKYMEEHFLPRQNETDTEVLKSKMLSWMSSNKMKPDDQTFVIFQWKGSQIIELKIAS